MQNVLAPQPVPSFDPLGFSHAPMAVSFPASCAQEDCPDHQFIAMLDAYRDSGGLARKGEVLAWLTNRCGPQAPTLAHCVTGRDSISFEWQLQTWLPWFQFKPIEPTPPPELGPVIAELRANYNGWELAHWFVQPNAWLAQRTPVEMLAFDPPTVLNAARKERLLRSPAHRTAPGGRLS